MKSKITSCLLFVFLMSTSLNAQFEQYDYKRQLQGVTDQWHKMTLPGDVFSKISPSLFDIRIYGITAGQDTIEAPYMLRPLNEKIISLEVDFDLINQSRNEKGFFYTYEIPSQKAINQIKLDFKKNNFDWRLKLEGSQDQKEWFTLTENYRILSIKNDRTDYQFTTVSFPAAKYRYFRIQLDSNENPRLAAAKISLLDVVEGQFQNHPINSFKTTENKQAKQTEIDVNFGKPVYLSHFNINITKGLDYYRPVTIKYLIDSVKAQSGWNYHYGELTSGTLTSLENNVFTFPGKTVQQIKMVIYNQDNAPLLIESIEAKGYLYELVARFTEPANYFLAYGNSNAAKPRYDIDRFTDKVPANLKELNLGAEQVIEKKKIVKKEPLFKNKLWLWGIMALIIGLLGWFSLKMIRDGGA